MGPIWFNPRPRNSSFFRNGWWKGELVELPQGALRQWHSPDGLPTITHLQTFVLTAMTFQ